MSKFLSCWNVLIKNKNEDDDICLHQTLEGAINCQKIRGGEIVEEQIEDYLFKEIEK